MSVSPKYARNLGNLTRRTPVQLDPVLFAGTSEAGADCPFNDVGPPVSPNLWARPEADLSYMIVDAADVSAFS